jgi:hypothetical protein
VVIRYLVYHVLACFDEIYEQAAYREPVFCELYEASNQKKDDWVFKPECSGEKQNI